MKANFRLSKNHSDTNVTHAQKEKESPITPEEFEEFVIKSGATGSFMVFRSDKKEDELGVEEL